MPINNALTPEGQNALGAAFGYYPQLRRNRTVQDPRLAAEMPLQFLRGRLAGTLGLPSDVANLVRTPMPMEMYGDVDYGPQAQVPYGSQELLRTLPFPPQGPAQAAAANVGAAVPLTPMEALQAARAARQAALATGRAVGPTAAGMAENLLQRQGLILPLDVYHGTPYTLPPTARNPLGEFDASKIGTGEGAQAYGYGIYTAEAPAVAKQYRDTLSFPEVRLKDGSKVVNSGQLDAAMNYLDAASKSKNPFKEALTMAAKDKDLNALRQLKELQSKGASVDVGGSLYKIDLPDAMIPKMLDYDKPYSQQHPDVKAALKSIVQSEYTPKLSQIVNPLNKNPMSYSLELLNEQLGNQQITANYLQQAGIPGIKYLDEASRAKGEGTRNFVTFPGEEKNLKILERNPKTR
jgi:hypothetical protein